MINSNSKTLVNKLASAKNINYTPLFLILILTLQIISIIQLMFQGSLLLQELNEPASRFVELANGQTVKTTPINSRERSTEVIDKFTRTMMEMLFSASNTIIDSQGKTIQELGVEINGQTTSERTAIALLFVEPEILPILLEDIAQVTSPEIFQGKSTRVLKIRYLSKPRKIENQEGQWELEMVANLYSYERQEQKLLASKFNKKIRLRIVDYPTDTFQAFSLNLNQQLLNLMDKEYLKQVFGELSNAGLEISLISPL